MFIVGYRRPVADTGYAVKSIGRLELIHYFFKKTYEVFRFIYPCRPVFVGATEL
jgi:hypothetical protein